MTTSPLSLSDTGRVMQTEMWRWRKWIRQKRRRISCWSSYGKKSLWLLRMDQCFFVYLDLKRTLEQKCIVNRTNVKLVLLRLVWKPSTSCCWYSAVNQLTAAWVSIISVDVTLRPYNYIFCVFLFLLTFSTMPKATENADDDADDDKPLRFDCVLS